MRLLLTGASGFLGRNILLGAPTDWQIVALYNSDEGFPAFLSARECHHVVPVRCDLGRPDDVSVLAANHGADWDACLYLAAKVDIPWSVSNPGGDLAANTVPLLNLLGSVRVDRFVYFSSGAVYDGATGEAPPTLPLNPTLPYAISKLACERYVQFYQARRGSIAKYLTVRFFGAYGPYEAPHKIYTRLVRSFVIERRRRYTIYGDGRNLIDAMYVDDAVEAVRRMLAGDHWNMTLNLTGGNPITIEELVHSVAAALGAEAVQVEKTGRANERNEFWGTVREMREQFAFEPRIPLTEGIRRLRDFLVSDHAARCGQQD